MEGHFQTRYARSHAYEDEERNFVPRPMRRTYSKSVDNISLSANYQPAHISTRETERPEHYTKDHPRNVNITRVENVTPQALKILAESSRESLFRAKAILSAEESGTSII
jgi:hypothetical protein